MEPLQEGIIPVYAIPYSKVICCHDCGRQNWTLKDKRMPNGRRRFDVEHSLFAVRPDFKMPTSKSSIALCSDCLKERITAKMQGNDYALYVKGTCEDSFIHPRHIVLNFETEAELTAWLIRKAERDAEVYEIRNDGSIMLMMVELATTHTLQVQGKPYTGECYRILCRHFGFSRFSERCGFE